MPNSEEPRPDTVQSAIDTGEMVQITSMTPFSICWRSSKKGSWCMSTEFFNEIVEAWDGASTVVWVWSATFLDERKGKASVTISPHMMEKIKVFLASL